MHIRLPFSLGKKRERERNRSSSRARVGHHRDAIRGNLKNSLIDTVLCFTVRLPNAVALSDVVRPAHSLPCAPLAGRGRAGPLRACLTLPDPLHSKRIDLKSI